jgi:hypothetical protein
MCGVFAPEVHELCQQSKEGRLTTHVRCSKGALHVSALLSIAATVDVH